MNGFLSSRRAFGSIIGGLFIIVSLYGCGGSGGDEGGSAQGSLAFKLSILDSPARQASALNSERELSEFPCEAHLIETIEVEVLLNETTVREARFLCKAHHGTINDVPAGSTLSMNVFARDAEDTAIFEGSMEGLTVVGGETTDAGTVELRQITDRAPVLDSIGNKSVDENRLLAINLSARDPDDKDILTFSASQILEDGRTADLPAGASLTDHHNRTAIFQWKTDYNESGIYKILFKVEDNSTLDRGPLGDSKLIYISVGNVNQTPVIEPIGKKTVFLQPDYDTYHWTGELEFKISATDPDVLDKLKIVIFSSSYPYIMKYAENLLSPTSYEPNSNSYTATFKWNPKCYWDENCDDIGSHKVTFQVADDGTPSIAVSETITIEVKKDEQGS